MGKHREINNSERERTSNGERGILRKDYERNKPYNLPIQILLIRVIIHEP
jgi:hypothetical protein